MPGGYRPPKPSRYPAVAAQTSRKLCTVRGFTPIIGLAVVVALALAAVLGAMSLANPVQAQVADASGTPICTAAGFIPDQGVALGEDETYDVDACFGGTGVNATGVRSSDDTIVSVALEMGNDTPPEATGDIVVTGEALGTASVTVVTAANGHKTFMVEVYNTGPMVGDPIPDQSLGTSGVSAPGVDTRTIDVSDYFDGADISYDASSSNSTDITAVVTANTSNVVITATGTAVVGDSALITVTATNPVDNSGVRQTFTVYVDSTPDILADDDASETGDPAGIQIDLDDLREGSTRVIDVSDYFSGTRNVYTVHAAESAGTVPATLGDFESDSVGAEIEEDTSMLTLTGKSRGVTTNIVITATNGGGNASVVLRLQVSRSADPELVEDMPDAPFKVALEQSSFNPGKNARYTFKFNASMDYVPGLNDIVIKLTYGDFQVPETISTSTVTIQAGNKVASPADISVDDTEITLVLGDMDGDADGVQGIGMGENVTIVFRTSAGIKNPEEGGVYDEDLEIDGQMIPALTIKRTISLSEDEGGRGDEIMVTGKGFKNGTSVTFLRMMDDGLTAADFAAGTSLCAGLASDGVATCSFTVTSPLFKYDKNYINAVDGRSNRGSESEPFTLEPSISVSPEGGSPGESLLVQLYDFAPGATVSAVKIARRTLCVPNAGGAVSLMATCASGYTALKPSGTSFRVVIPNDAPLGRQDLQVVTTGGSDNTNINISGPLVTSTPSTVLANQRVSLIGNGFTPSSDIKEITFAGTRIESGRINDGFPVRIDAGGNWNASVNLPLNTSTVSAGVHTIQIEDMGGRKGGIKVTVPERKVSITPSSGRVGTIAVVRGENFPSRNEEGNSFNVQIVYGSGDASSTTVSTVPDASGRFEAQMRIPTTSAIPSTNDVSVSFGTAQNGGPWTINVSHEVPEGIIKLSATSGSPGSALTISGEGFRSFVPVSSVMIGSIDISPTPRPSSDVNGMVSFDVVVPGLDVGIQTIEVQVGKTTASAGFTVTESGVNPGDIKPVAAALEPLGENLDSVWHFNNDTKAWNFYDGLEGSDLDHLITGETYLLQIKATTEVILNQVTRNLTCNAAGNCWNQIVW